MHMTTSDSVDQVCAYYEQFYAGQSYAVSAEGRMESRQVRLMVDGKPFEFGPAADGGLAIKDLPAGASLPAELPKGSYVPVVLFQRGCKAVVAIAIAYEIKISGISRMKRCSQ